MSRLSGHYGTHPLANKHKYEDYFKYKYKYVQICLQIYFNVFKYVFATQISKLFFVAPHHFKTGTNTKVVSNTNTFMIKLEDTNIAAKKALKHYEYVDSNPSEHARSTRH